MGGRLRRHRHTAHYLPIAVKSGPDLTGQEVTVLAKEVKNGFIYGELLSQPRHMAVLESSAL